MRYMFVLIWSALQIGFAVLFFAAFLEQKRRGEEVLWLGILAWMLTAIFAFFAVEGIYAYLAYLLAAVMILLSVHGEYGPKGLCLLAFSFLLPLTVDHLVLYLAAEIDAITYYLAVTAGKALPLFLALGMRRLKRREKAKNTPVDDTLLLKQHMEMQQESMAALEANYRAQCKSAHEFEHHLQVLRDLLDRDETDAAREYLQRLQKNRSIHVMSVSSNHPVVDVVLNQKYQTARENGIRMQIRVNDLTEISIPTDSLVVVLTNLLDNAIEACRRLEGYREIHCSVIYEDALYISIRNTSGEVKVVDGKISTSKADSLSHGFGLLSVSYVLDELDAEYTFGYEEGWFYFAAEIE